MPLQVIDPVRFNAYVELMAQPDPPDLPHRGHVLRYDGDPGRRAVMLPRMIMHWLQYRHLNVDNDGPLPIATKTVGDNYPTGEAHA